MPAVKYHFTIGPMTIQKYKDGTEVPHITLRIIADEEDWGYVEVHLHRVKVDPNEVDISVGTTVRVNPQRP